MLELSDPTAVGAATDSWTQKIFDNADGSMTSLWLPGSGYNRSIVAGSEALDYIGARNLSKVGAPTVGAYSAVADPSNYYTHPATAGALASGGAGGTVLNRAIGNLNYNTSPTQIANNDTLTVNGVVITFKATGASGTHEVNIGANGTATFGAVAALINANTALYGVTAYVISSNHQGSIYFFSNALGVAGNSITLAQSLSCTGHTLSGATLTGGDKPGLTLFAVAKTTSNGKFMPIGLWDSGDVMQVSLGMWATGTASYNEGVTAYHYNTSSARFAAKVPGESGVEGVSHIFGVGAFMSGEVWGGRRHSASSAMGAIRNSTGTPGDLPTATGPLRVGSPNGTNGATNYPNGGTLAVAGVVNRFLTPLEWDSVLYAPLKANLLTAVGISI